MGDRRVTTTVGFKLEFLVGFHEYADPPIDNDDTPAPPDTASPPLIRLPTRREYDSHDRWLLDAVIYQLGPTAAVSEIIPEGDQNSLALLNDRRPPRKRTGVDVWNIKWFVAVCHHVKNLLPRVPRQIPAPGAPARARHPLQTYQWRPVKITSPVRHLRLLLRCAYAGTDMARNVRFESLARGLVIDPVTRLRSGLLAQVNESCSFVVNVGFGNGNNADSPERLIALKRLATLLWLGESRLAKLHHPRRIRGTIGAHISAVHPLTKSAAVHTHGVWDCTQHVLEQGDSDDYDSYMAPLLGPPPDHAYVLDQARRKAAVDDLVRADRLSEEARYALYRRASVDRTRFDPHALYVLWMAPDVDALAQLLTPHSFRGAGLNTLEDCAYDFTNLRADVQARLPSRQRTVAFRLAAGTLDPKLVLAWTQLCAALAYQAVACKPVDFLHVCAQLYRDRGRGVREIRGDPPDVNSEDEGRTHSPPGMPVPFPSTPEEMLARRMPLFAMPTFLPESPPLFPVDMQMPLPMQVQVPVQIPQQMPQQMFEQMPEQMPEYVPEYVPEYMPEQMPMQMPMEMAMQMPMQVPMQIPHQMPEHMFEQMPEQMPMQMPMEMPMQAPVQMTMPEFQPWAPAVAMPRADLVMPRDHPDMSVPLPDLRTLEAAGDMLTLSQQMPYPHPNQHPGFFMPAAPAMRLPMPVPPAMRLPPPTPLLRRPEMTMPECPLRVLVTRAVPEMLVLPPHHLPQAPVRLPDLRTALSDLAATPPVLPILLPPPPPVPVHELSPREMPAAAINVTPDDVRRLREQLRLIATEQRDMLVRARRDMPDLRTALSDRAATPPVPVHASPHLEMLAAAARRLTEQVRRMAPAQRDMLVRAARGHLMGIEQERARRDMLAMPAPEPAPVAQEMLPLVHAAALMAAQEAPVLAQPQLIPDHGDADNDDANNNDEAADVDGEEEAESDEEEAESADDMADPDFEPDSDDPALDDDEPSNNYEEEAGDDDDMADGGDEPAEEGADGEADLDDDMADRDYEPSSGEDDDDMADADDEADADDDIADGDDDEAESDMDMASADADAAADADAYSDSEAAGSDADMASADADAAADANLYDDDYDSDLDMASADAAAIAHAHAYTNANPALDSPTPSPVPEDNAPVAAAPLIPNPPPREPGYETPGSSPPGSPNSGNSNGRNAFTIWSFLEWLDVGDEATATLRAFVASGHANPEDQLAADGVMRSYPRE